MKAEVKGTAQKRKEQAEGKRSPFEPGLEVHRPFFDYVGRAVRRRGTMGTFAIDTA